LKKNILTMRNLYAALLVLFSVFATHAQIVDIPDPAFKAKLLSSSANIDTNGDGEIQQSEAAAVTSLSFSMCNFDNMIGIQSFVNLEHISFSSYCSVASTVDLSGMASIKSMHFHKSSPSVDVAGLVNLESISAGYSNPNFLHFEQTVNLRTMSYYISSVSTIDLTHAPNMVSFSSDNTNIDSINVDGLTQLENLSIEGSSLLTNVNLSDLVNLKTLKIEGGLTSLDLTNNTLLEELTIAYANLNTLNVSHLTHLKDLSCYSSHLTSLDLSQNVELETLMCSNNELTSLNLSNNINLKSLYCDHNQLTSIDLTNLHKLYRIYLTNNLFTALDFSGQTEVIPGDTPIYEVRDNPNLVMMNLKNGKHDYAWINDINCPNLVYLCIDDVDMDSFNFALVNYGITTIQINNYCNFVPGGNYNTISGTVAFHQDGCGNGTGYGMPRIRVNFFDGTDTASVFTNDNGQYTFYAGAGDFTITPQISSALLSMDPTSANISFADNLNHTGTLDFCTTPVGNVQDLEISIIPARNARPGFDTDYEIVYHNKGNQMLSGSVSFAYDDSLTDLVSSNPAADSQSTGNLSWNYTNLLPSESRTIAVKLNVNSPMEIPAVNIGDILHFDATILPMVGSNHFILNQTVVGSYDPNDKTCLEGTSMTPEQVGKYLNYVIRFQNSGTAAAENVVVKDMIDTEKFDMDSLQFTSSSHPHTTRINGNKIEFIFEGINLPAEIDDEPASHGYVAFKIKTKGNLVLGNEVSNTADIYFDYNFPITTNTASTTVALLAKDNFEDTTVSVYPNPTSDKVTITAKDKITSVQLFDLQGRLVQTTTGNHTNVNINLSGKSSGVYFVKVHTAKGVTTEKIIKE
jgi:uncharacterized repeat protein (TIGR01451 family)